MSERFIIIDGSLTNRFDYNFLYTREIKQVLSARNIPTEVFISVTADDDVLNELNARRALFSNVYTSYPIHPDYHFPTYWLETNKAIEQDMHTIASIGLDNSDRLLFHSTWSSQSFGICRWYRRLPTPRPKICLQFHSSHVGIARPFDQDLSLALYKKSLECWGPLTSDVILCSTSDELSAFLADLSGLKVHSTPIIVDPPNNREPASVVKRPKIGLVGSPRKDRGFDLIMNVFHHDLQRYEFDIVKQDTKLSRKDYKELLQACDAFILPYRPESYHLRASAVFVEALASGRPVVVPPGGWSANELGKWGNPGVIADRYDAAAFAVAIGTLLADFGTYQQRAMSVAPFMRRHFSAETYLDLLAGIGFGGAAPSLNPS